MSGKDPIIPATRSGSAATENASACPLLITVVEAAKLLGCSRANIYGLIDAGELPIITIGLRRGHRIDRRDIEEFVSRRKILKEGGRSVRPAARPRLKHIKL